MNRSTLVALCGFFSGPVLAQSAAGAPAQSPGLPQLLTVLLSLLLVVALIVALAWLVRRAGIGQGLVGRQGPIKILASQALGARERLVLTEVGGQQVLLGVTTQSIQTLLVLDEPVSVEKNSSSQSLFHSKLQSILSAQAPQNKNKGAGNDQHT